MERYIGLDVHSQSCTLAVVGPSGKRLKSQVVETNGKALVEAIKSVAGDRHLCIEEGTQSAWLHEILEPHVEDFVVTVPNERKGKMKDDLRDAFALAEQLRIGAIETRVFKAPAQFSGLRNAVRAYGMVQQDVVRVKNRLKAIYRSRGIETDSSIYNSLRRKSSFSKLPVSHRKLAEHLSEELDGLLPVQEKAEAWLKTEAKGHPIIRKLGTAPGMGPIRTAQLVAVVVSPHRFRTSRQFWSYCGFGIVTRSSADWIRGKSGQWLRAEKQQTRGLNRRRNPLLKHVFKGAASTVIQQMPEHPIHQHYQRMLQAGIKPNLAKLTTARRIAAAVLAMWKHKEEYDPERARAVKKD